MRTRLIVLVLLVAGGGAVLLLAGLGSCGDGDERLDRAAAHLADGRFAEARRLLVAAHGTRPSAHRAAVLLARAQRECGRPEEALAVLGGVARVDRDRDDVQEERARALHDRALIHRGFRETGTPDGPARQARAARDMSLAGDLARALAERTRKDESLLLLAARTELGAGRRGAARTWLEEARLAGADPTICDSLEALALAQSGDRTGAEERLRALVRAHPDHAWALWSLAVLVRSAGARDEARVLLQRAVAADELHPMAGVDLARTLRDLGDPGAAANAARAFMDVRPDHLGALRVIARMRGTKQRWTDAIEALEHAAETHAGDPEVLNELGMALAEGAGWKNERLTEAIRVHEKGLAIDRRHVGNAYNLARCLVTWNRTEKLERAILIYEQLIGRFRGQAAWKTLLRDWHGNVALVYSDSFKSWKEAYPHYVAYFEMGGEVTRDYLDEWGKVLKGLEQPFREPPRPGR